MVIGSAVFAGVVRNAANGAFPDHRSDGLASSRMSPPGAWSDQRQPLYHGIPARIAVRGVDPVVLDACWRHLLDAERHLSFFAPTSELSRLNAAPIQHGFHLTPSLSRCLRAAVEAHRLSRGSCDASAGALVSLWRRAVRDQRWPDPGEIAFCLSHTGLAGIGIGIGMADGTMSCAGLRREFDLGGVAKGVLVDEVDQLLRAAGAEDILVQIGGETSCRGRSPSGRPWRIGVQHPLLGDAVWTALEAPRAGLSCSTSGDYRRSWMIGDRPVSHLIDPRTGDPASDDLLGATVAISAGGKASATEALTKAAVFLPTDAALMACGEARAEMLVLRAEVDGVEEIRSAGWRDLEAP